MGVIKNVSIQPTVLLGITDHHFRVASDSGNRVVGILLGSVSSDVVTVSNAFAVPFDEDRKDPRVWYFDRLYAMNMFEKMRRVNIKEKIVGWYSTSTSLKDADVDITHTIGKLGCGDPVLLCVDVSPEREEVPTKAYHLVQRMSSETQALITTFDFVSSSIDPVGVERVGIGHLIRESRRKNLTTAQEKVKSRLDGFVALDTRLDQIMHYIDEVIDHKASADHGILGPLQDVLTDVNRFKASEVSSALEMKLCDASVVMAVGTLARAVLSADSLMTNRLHQQQLRKNRTENAENSALLPSAKNGNADSDSSTTDEEYFEEMEGSTA